MIDLVIGTAQWGLNYGVTNSAGRLTDDAVQGLIGIADQFQISAVDTAAGYGDAETRIGRLSWPGISIQTKISGATENPFADIENSLARLKRSRIDSVLVHDWFALSAEQKSTCVAALEKAKSRELVTDIGISAYEIADLDSARLNFTTVDIAQIPINALDQRFTDPTVRKAHSDTKFQARSVFLQGLLASNDSQRQEFPALVEFDRFTADYDTDPLSAALGFLAKQNWLDSIVIAPTSVVQFVEILAAWANAQHAAIDWDYSPLACTDKKLLDPRTW